MPKIGDMRNKAALVTGAASGLGRATALELGRAGAAVCLVDVNDAGLRETFDQLRAVGATGLVYVTDLAVGGNCREAVAAAVKAFGRLDALCNVAGVLIPSHTADMSPGDWERTLAVNLSAPFYLIQAAMPHLLEAQGAVVNVTSQAALIGQAYTAAYCAAKAGLTHITKALAMEYMHKPVRINAVAPGGMMTTLARNTRMPEGADPTLLKRFVPLRGLVEIDDVAEMVAFLASDAARGYHGACISVDHGITAG
ncbi:MAG: SDR family oxidoreductase [Rhodospirillaceae bacterium]|nr:MAG: SDR family oxidoreductase [Rhodospirillaceae bacterium]